MIWNVIQYDNLQGADDLAFIEGLGTYEHISIKVTSVKINNRWFSLSKNILSGKNTHPDDEKEIDLDCQNTTRNQKKRVHLPNTLDRNLAFETK